MPLLVLLRNEIHTSIIDKFIEKNNYIHPGCEDIACSKEAVYKIVYDAPIILYSKHDVERNHPTFGNYFLESNKPLLPDPYTLVKHFELSE